MANVRISYFEEQRNRNNAAFYEKMTDMQLRNIVRRLIKDMYNGIIKDQDKVYFMNSRIMSACLYVSATEKNRCHVLSQALWKYLNEQPVEMYGDPQMLKAIAADTYNDVCARFGVWSICYEVFLDISNGRNFDEAASRLSVISDINAVNKI